MAITRSGHTELTAAVRGRVPTIGAFVNLASPLATEVLALAGFDWLLVDLEHGGGDEGQLVGQLHAAAARGIPVVARVESGDRIRTGRVLDLGVAGVMLPRVDSLEESLLAMSNLRYPPAGRRGVATYNRARDFGLDTRALSAVDEEVLSAIQIETAAALDNVEAIAAGSAADILFVGPSDLSVALGVGGRPESPVFQAALDRILAAAEAVGSCPGILATDETSAIEYVQRGFRFVAISSDAALLLKAAREVTAALRGYYAHANTVHVAE